MRINTLTIFTIGLVATAGCKKKQDDAPVSKPAATGAAAAPKPADTTKKSCADWPGFAGKGDFSDMCKSKGPSAFEAVWTGQFKKNLFNEEVPSFNVTSHFDRDVSWANVSVWVYDKDGKLLDINGSKRSYQNGSGILKLAAGETAEFGFGPDKKTVPAEATMFVAEVSGWGWDTEPSMYFSAHDGVASLDDRPKDGWK